MKDHCPSMVGNFETGRVDMTNIKSFKDYVYHFSIDEPLLKEAIAKVDPENYYKVNIEPYTKLFAIYVGMKGIV